MEKARMVLSENVWRKIEWFTHNFDKEIGAFGTGRIKSDDGDKYFYVDELYFPKQEVTGATIKITQDGWAPIIQELGSLNAMKNIVFYWHRHPGGSPHHSSTDEKDTFGTFMAKEANRPYFLFLQTASSNGDTKFEARIELRKPIRATIEDDAIEIQYESEEDTELEKYCKKIIEDRVTTAAVTSSYKGTTFKQSYKHKSSFDYDFSNTYNAKVNNSKKTEVSFMEFVSSCYNNDINIISTDFIKEVDVSPEDRLHLEYSGGNCEFTVGQNIEEPLEKTLKENQEFVPLVDTFWKKSDTNDKITFTIKPTDGNFGKLFYAIKMFIGGAIMDLYPDEFEKPQIEYKEDSLEGKTAKVYDYADYNEEYEVTTQEYGVIFEYMPDFIDCKFESIPDGYRVIDKNNIVLGQVKKDPVKGYILKGSELIEEAEGILYSMRGIRQLYGEDFYGY